jgi:hypothetical protein
MAPYTNIRNRNPVAKLAIAGFALVTLVLTLHIAAIQECHLFHSVAWLAFQVLRPAILATSQSAPTHLCDASSLLQPLLQMVASVRPLLWVIAG